MSKHVAKKTRKGGGAKAAAGNGAKIPVFANGGNVCLIGDGRFLPVRSCWADSIPCSSCPDRLYWGAPRESPYLYGGDPRDSIYGGYNDQTPPIRRRQQLASKRRAKRSTRQT